MFFSRSALHSGLMFLSSCNCARRYQAGVEEEPASAICVRHLTLLMLTGVAARTLPAVPERDPHQGPNFSAYASRFGRVLCGMQI